MLRSIYYLSLILFSHGVLAAPEIHAYAKQGAPVVLATPSYKLENSTAPQVVELVFYVAKSGSMKLSYSSSNGAEIIEATTTELLWNNAKPKLSLPVTVSTEPNGKSYLNVFVIFTDDNGAITSRAISAILNTGQAPANKTSGSPPSVISMRAIETISINQ